MTALRISLCSLAMALANLLSFPAESQTAFPDPTFTYADNRNIDLLSGTYFSEKPLISVGDSAVGLALRLYPATQVVWKFNYIGGVYSGLQTPISKTIFIGNRSWDFSFDGTTYHALDGMGETLVAGANGAFTFTDRTGMVASFQNFGVKGGLSSNATQSRYAYDVGALTRIVYPNGFRVDLTYSQATSCITFPNANCAPANQLHYIRLQSVNSNTGYQLKFSYWYDFNPSDAYNTPTIMDSGYAYDWQALKVATAINNAVEYCSPTANTCALSNNWPTMNVDGTFSDITDPLGRTTEYVPGAVGSGNKFSAIKFPSSTQSNILLEYDSAGRISKYTIAAPSGNLVWTYTYTDASYSGYKIRTITVTNPSMAVRTVVARINVSPNYGAYIISDTDFSGKTTSYEYDGFVRPTKITLPEGNYKTIAYDDRGNVTQSTMIDKSGSTLTNIVTLATYPTTCANQVTCNSPTSITDARHNVVNYTYDPTHGNVLTVTGSAVGGINPQTRYSYSAFQAYYKNSSGSIVASGLPVYKLTGTSACRVTSSCAGGTDETKTTVSYGSQTAGTANNLLPISFTTAVGTGSLSAVTSATYDAVGNIVTATDPLNRMTRYLYDADRELIEVVSPDPDGSGPLKNRAQRLTYNADGLVTLTEQGTSATDGSAFATLQQVATNYDSVDRKIQDSAQAGGTTYAVIQYGYDAAGRLQCTVQRMNPAVFGSLPSSACSLGTTGSYGPDRITFITYDSADRMIKTTTGYGVAGLQRDDQRVTYTDNGLVKTLADAKNNLTTYVYDGFDRLYQTQYPSPTTAGTSNASDFEQLGYDGAGNVTSRRLRDGTSIGYGYDALNRLSSKTLPNGEHGVTYAYDNLGHPTTITGATALSYGWDALGRETSETQAYGSVAYQYDAAGRRTSLTWQDGTYLTYDYDNADEMTDIKENGGTVLASFSYDDLGERKTRTLANGTSTTYGYDPISRLTSLALAGGTNANAVTLSNYSPAGEIGGHANSNDAFAWGQGYNLNRTYTINGLNQFSAIAGAAQGYDARGNLTSSGGTTYAYTAENLLKTVSGGYTLTYDPIGRLQEYDLPTATRFVYDGGMISEEFNSSGTVLRRYAFGLAGDEPIVWYEGSGTGTKRYLDQDERGSITRITNQDGSTYAINSYDEYGIPGSSNQGRFGYTGQAWLSEIGLAHYKARMYSPTLGRFLQTDPVGYADGPNWYNYVHSDPINLIDEFGTQAAESNDPLSSSIIVNGQESGLLHVESPHGGPGIGSVEVGRFPNGEPKPAIGDLILVNGHYANLRLSNLASLQNDMDAAAASSVGCGSCMSGDNEIVVTANTSLQPYALAVATASPELLAEEGGGGIFAAIGRFFSRVFGRTACFAAGTLVQTDHGLRPIETIKPGDMVLSRDEKTGVTSYRRVTAVKVPTRDELYDVNLDVPEGVEAEHHADFEVTATHPWRTLDGRWVPTLQLRRGMKLVRSDGFPAQVISLHDTGSKAPTYNLTVEGSHTYFVGKDHLWVHNACRFYRGSLRQQVFSQKGVDCIYCGQPATQVDHVNPWSRGGETTFENGVPACASCNASKGAKTPDEWFGLGPE